MIIQFRLLYKNEADIFSPRRTQKKKPDDEQWDAEVCGYFVNAVDAN